MEASLTACRLWLRWSSRLWHGGCIGAVITTLEVVSPMCMNCGCGKPNDRHKEGDIILDDLERAAKNHNLEVEQVADNIHQSARQLKEQGAIT